MLIVTEPIASGTPAAILTQMGAARRVHIRFAVRAVDVVPVRDDPAAGAMLETERAKGTSAEALNAMAKEFETFKVQYKDPLIRLPMTFLEIFPVGLIVALISAAILRNPRALPAQA